MTETLVHILMLLGVTMAVVILFQRLYIPASLGYLLVGVMLGPHTVGPTVHVPGLKAIAEFGVVFLLFTIGLNFALPQLHALRHQVLGLGTAQVALSTAAVMLLLWLAGLDAPVAFVIGAVFAQSSTSIIGSQLTEQGENNLPHGRLGVAMSVFQDITAVPFLVVIPVLGSAVGAQALGITIAGAGGKALLAIVLVFVLGRWLLRPLFQLITRRQSAEVFTLAVLLVSLLSAWSTSLLGLSLAFGAFLAGMMLGETEFRHQVESSIRPFRDLLLGLFFIGIGMLFEPRVIPAIWHLALLGMLLLVLTKVLIVTAIVRLSGIDSSNAWRTGLLLGVGGEFGFALLAIALDNQVVSLQIGQITLTAVLFSMVLGAVLIRFNQPIARKLSGSHATSDQGLMDPRQPFAEPQVVIGGYGRMGHAIAVLLQNQNIPFIAFDIDPQRVAQGRSDGHPVMYGDLSDPELLQTLGIERAVLVVVSLDHGPTALRTVSLMNALFPQVPVIARARDLQASRELLEAGASQAYPETLEASLLLGECTLKMLQVPEENIAQLLQEIRDWGYGPVTV
jgi:CPA2 family monovalent cation:H+ antiporter-2